MGLGPWTVVAFALLCGSGQASTATCSHAQSCSLTPPAVSDTALGEQLKQALCSFYVGTDASRLFLMYMAFAEQRFYAQNGTAPPSHGGPWFITEAMFNDTLFSLDPLVVDAYAELKVNHGVTWNLVPYDQLAVDPRLSAFAAWVRLKQRFLRSQDVEHFVWSMKQKSARTVGTPFHSSKWQVSWGVLAGIWRRFYQRAHPADSRLFQEVVASSTIVFESCPRAQYNEHDAQRFAHLSLIAYCDAKRIHDWSCERCPTEPRPQWVQPVSTKADSELLAFVAVEAGAMTVAFRGTNGFLQLFRTDIYPALLRKHHPTWTGTPRAVRVHEGFLKAYSSLRNEVIRAVAHLRRQAGSELPIVVTGHSLGAALATLFAADMQTHYKLAGFRSPPVAAVWTFGSPRVGNSFFANWFNSLVPRSWRVMHRYDIVTMVPSADLRYHHVKGAVWYGEHNDEIGRGPFTFCSLDRPFDCNAKLQLCKHESYWDHRHYMGFAITNCTAKPPVVSWPPQPPPLCELG